MVTHVDGYAERDAALLMLQQKQFGRSRASPWCGQGLRREGFVRTVRELNVTPHVTKNDKAGRAIWTAGRRASLATPSA